MSFDLAFWYAARPSSPEAAQRLYQRLVDGEPDVLAGSARIRQLYEDILSAYGDMGDDGDDASPWMSPIYRTDACLMVAISWRLYRDVAPALTTMALDRGVTTYDPQSRTVHSPAPRWAGSPAPPRATLAPYTGPEIPDPSHADIEFTVRRLSDREWFALLEKRPQEYVQVGYGEQAGTRPGWYVIERREGSAEHHFRTETPDMAAVVRAFADYSRGDELWKRRFGWRRVTM